MTAFEKLRVEVPAPENPFANNGDWNHVELELGLALPTDYKTFISTYGSGKICGFVLVDSPFVRNRNWSLIPYVSETILAYRSYVETKVLNSIPYPLYPEKGGLLPFGTTENSNCLNWLTLGSPDEWGVIIWEPDFLQFFDTGYRSLTAFLADLIEQRHGLIPDDPPLDWFNSPRSFTPIDFDGPDWL